MRDAGELALESGQSSSDRLIVDTIARMTVVRSAPLDSQFTPSVTFCARRRTTKWARISDEARWAGIANDPRGAAHFVALAISRTTNGADEQVRSWARLLGIDADVVTSRAVALPWLWAGSSSCVAAVTITQQGPLTVVQVFQYAYNAEYEWPDHLGGDGLRTFILDALDQFDPKAKYSGLPDHMAARLENCVRSRTSALVAEIANTAIGNLRPELQDDGDPLESIWRLRTALRRVIARLHDQQPEAITATSVLNDAVSEIDTLLGVLNTQQLLQRTIADSRARKEQKQRDAEEARRERDQAEREARRDKAQAEKEALHNQTLAIFATVFIGPSLVFAFFSLPSSPQWQTRCLLLWALVSIIAVGLSVFLVVSLLTSIRRLRAKNSSER